MFLLGFACGAAAGGTVVYYVLTQRRTRTITPPPPAPPVDFYGHPVDLGAELAQHLPHIDGYLWERGVKFNAAGEPLLCLVLLDARVLPATAVAECSVNLRWRKPDPGFSWAADYQQFGADYTADWARKEIVVPLLHWAQAQAVKYGGGEVEQYGIQS